MTLSNTDQLTCAVFLRWPKNWLTYAVNLRWPYIYICELTWGRYLKTNFLDALPSNKISLRCRLEVTLSTNQLTYAAVLRWPYLRTNFLVLSSWGDPIYKLNLLVLQAATLTENQTGSTSRTAAHHGGDGNLYDRNYCRQCSNVVCSLWPSKTCTGRYGRTKINSLLVEDPTGKAKSLFLRLQGLMIFSFFLSESTPIGTAGPVSYTHLTLPTMAVV